MSITYFKSFNGNRKKSCLKKTFGFFQRTDFPHFPYRFRRALAVKSTAETRPFSVFVNGEVVSRLPLV